ncbi:hypothetical protein HDF23_004732 [Mucilaginibacter lappiensis]|uniref:Uncharacterized protein n=1 Tax=Mucilaginibacter lappiensis TaxID=354630 RepID=A0ABR6PS40_9SPHI|nr:hypothetical protein [Mucilaginibacter lappiensis]
MNYSLISSEHDGTGHSDEKKVIFFISPLSFLKTKVSLYTKRKYE